MDYDDELNDEEEKDYKKELIGSDASEEVEEEMEEESEESIIPEPKLLPQRSTRGQRMNLLVGKAKEEDEELYNGLFAEGDSDESFESQGESESLRRDSFDSDFDKSDSDEERYRVQKKGEVKPVKLDESDSEEERNLAKREKKERKKNVKFDQTGAKHKTKALQKQTNEDEDAVKLGISAELRKSNRIRTTQTILKKRPRPKDLGNIDLQKKRQRQSKVSFGGSLANPEFQGILNNAAL